MASAERKYEFTGEEIDYYKVRLRQIRAIKDFGIVKRGNVGGWIEKEDNLLNETHDSSGNAWVFGNAKVFGDAWVFGNALVYNNAEVYHNAWVCGNAYVFENAEVFERAKVYDNSRVSGNARVFGRAIIGGEAKIHGNVSIHGKLVIVSDLCLPADFEHDWQIESWKNNQYEIRKRMEANRLFEMECKRRKTK